MNATENPSARLSRAGRTRSHLSNTQSAMKTLYLSQEPPPPKAPDGHDEPTVQQGRRASEPSLLKACTRCSASTPPPAAKTPRRLCPATDAVVGAVRDAVIGMSTGLRANFTPEQPRTLHTTTPTTLAAWVYDTLRTRSVAITARTRGPTYGPLTRLCH